jgi:hypothetical protein
LLEDKRVLGTALEVTEVEGAIQAYKQLETFHYGEFSDLLKAHQLLMKGILKNAGKFRTTNALS